jgi:hypothetical protein
VRQVLTTAIFQPMPPGVKPFLAEPILLLSLALQEVAGLAFG